MEQNKLKQVEEDAEYSTYLSILRKNHIKSHNKQKQCLDCFKMQNNSTFKREKNIIRKIKCLLLFLAPLLLTLLTIPLIFIIFINNMW